MWDFDLSFFFQQHLLCVTLHIYRWLFRPDFQEQLQEIDKDLAWFDTDEERSKELGDWLLTTTVWQPSLSREDKGTGTMFAIGQQGVQKNEKGKLKTGYTRSTIWNRTKGEGAHFVQAQWRQELNFIKKIF